MFSKKKKKADQENAFVINQGLLRACVILCQGIDQGYIYWHVAAYVAHFLATETSNFGHLTSDFSSLPK